VLKGGRAARHLVSWGDLIGVLVRRHDRVVMMVVVKEEMVVDVENGGGGGDGGEGVSRRRIGRVLGMIFGDRF